MHPAPKSHHVVFALALVIALLSHYYAVLTSLAFSPGLDFMPLHAVACSVDCITSFAFLLSFFLYSVLYAPL